MNIQDIGSAITRSVASVAATSVAASSASSSPDVSGATSSKVDISKPGQFMSKLQSLMQSDPAQAKSALETMASNVRDQAQKVGGDEAKRLNAFADKLQQAADSGDLSGLQPKHHAGGHHHHGAPPAAGSDDTTSQNTVLASAGKDAYAKTHSQDKHEGKELWDMLNATLDGAVAKSSAGADHAVVDQG